MLSFHWFRMSVRNPSSRSRSIRRSIRTQRSEDTISNSLNSYSISDPERLVYIFKNRTNKIIFFFLMPDFFPDFMRTATEHVIPKDPYPNRYIFHHNIRKRKLHPKNCRSNNKVWMVPISMINFFLFLCFLCNIDKLYPKTDYNRNKEEKVGQDKPEKKPSTAARFARSIGMKRNEKETKLQNGDTAGRNTQTSPAIMPHHAVSRNLTKMQSLDFHFA